MKLYRSQFARLFALDEKIRSGATPTCSSFAREWEVNPKTIQRDIEFLRDSRGAPIEYDAAKGGFVYTDPSWRMEELDLSDADLLQLAVAQRMAAQYRGAPVAATLDQLFGKLRSVLAGATKIDPLDVDARFSFHGHPSREVAPVIWRAAARALRDGRVLRVDYRRFGAAEAKRRDLEPVHLASLDGEWTLVARIRGRSEFTLFSLSRVASARVTRTRCPAIEFDPQRFFENRFGRFVGDAGAEHQVVVRFSADAAAGVLERRWHTRQSVEKQADGGVVLRFPAPALYEIQRWVLQWGGDAEVLAPKELRDAVARESRRLARRYDRHPRSSRTPR